MVNIWAATCGLWLGCRSIDEVPVPADPATMALQASTAAACGRVIAY